MRSTIRPLRRLRQHLRARGIRGLQSGQGQPFRTILMFQEPHNLYRRVRRIKGLLQQLRGGRNFGFVIRRLKRWSLALRTAIRDEIINQANTVPLRDGPHFMLTICVEGCEADLGNFRLARFHLYLGSRVTNHQFATAVDRGQRQNQSSEHPAGLLRIAMRARKIPPVSYTSSLYNSADTAMPSQPRPVVTCFKMWSKLSDQDLPLTCTW